MKLSQKDYSLIDAIQLDKEVYLIPPPNQILPLTCRSTIHSRLLANKKGSREERSRYYKLERFPKFEGIAPLNPAYDRFRYCKFFKGIRMSSNELKLKSRYCKDLSFINEGLISPDKLIKLQLLYAFQREYGLRRSIETIALVSFSQLIPCH